MQENKLSFRGEFGRDNFLREEIADKVISLLNSGINISPMVIDGDWGTGKTEFCHKLINKFSAKHTECKFLYVDAFQADHADNPLMTILSGVMTLLPEGDQKTNLLEKSIPVVRYGLATLGKALVSHVLKQSADSVIQGFEDKLEKVSDDAIDASVKVLLKDHEEAEENLKSLQKVLSDIAAANPIFIFIDELDRCRPNFSVQLLEVIKHTFDVSGLKFILITNTKQLKASINHIYGAQVDAQRYLDKFLKFTFQLPEFIPGKASGKSLFSLASAEHFKNLISASEILSDSWLPRQNEKPNLFAIDLVCKRRLTLREVETFVRHLEIYNLLSQGLGPKVNSGFCIVRIFGVYIFCFQPVIAESIQNNTIEALDIGALLNVFSTPDFSSSNYQPTSASILGALLAQSSPKNTKGYVNSTNNPSNQTTLSQLRKEFFVGTADPGWIFDPIKKVIFCLRLGNP